MRLRPILFAAAAVLAALAPVSCSKSKAAKPSAAVQDSLEGKVLEVVAATPYAYVRLGTAHGEAWAAIPAFDLKVGSQVRILVQLKMDKFESPSLHRTFDAVYFGTVAGAAGEAPAAAPAASGQPAAPDAMVPKASGSEARTIAELYAHPKAVEGKTVLVRGKVVKYNEGIMHLTWLHLRDGSGTVQTQDNDLTVTSLDKARLGDVVTVRGIVHLNKDLGMGYKYPVILEDAKVAR